MSVNDLPISLANNPRLDKWISFEDGGGVRLATGKVELGHGVLTALAQMAAEELQVHPTRIRIVSGETEHSPDELFTAGSLTIQISGQAIRLVCAEIRGLFVDRAACSLACNPAIVTVDDGKMLCEGVETGLDYWSLRGEVDLARDALGAARLRSPNQFTQIGKSLGRIDLPAKISGAAFIHDLSFNNMLHARVLRQPRRNAQLVELDVDAISRATQGMASVIRIGNFVALIASEEAQAAAGLETARKHVKWFGGAARGASEAAARWLCDKPSLDRVVEAPGIANIRNSVTQIQGTYTRPYLAHASIGPSCALALWDGEILTVWTHSQGVFFLRDAIARVLDIDPVKVHVLHRQGSGCYGHNGADDVALDAALVAVERRGQPVRVLWTREDELSAGPVGPASTVKMSAAVDADGCPTTWEIEIWSGTHFQRPGTRGSPSLLAAEALPNALPTPLSGDVPDEAGGGGNRNSFAIYHLPPQRMTHHIVENPPLRTSALRGLGAHANVFAIECFVDELAEHAGVDPAVYRLAMLSDERARRVVAMAAASLCWQQRGPGGLGTGVGFAFSRYKNRAAYVAMAAEVEVNEDVRLKRIWCAVDAGLVINPNGALNQIEGGIIQAASWTLKEELTFDVDGNLPASWSEYPILRFSEVPEIEIELVDAREAPPLGIGEVVVGPTAASIGNAVAHALGVRIRDLPFSRTRIMSALLQE